MKLHCKTCNTQLTSEIYSTDAWDSEPRVDSDEDEMRFDYFIKPDTFIVGINPYFIITTPILMVNPDNVTIPIPDYESGMGCCNISHIPISCPNCGNEVAVANLDCWQDKSIDFDFTKCDKVNTIATQAPCR